LVRSIRRKNRHWNIASGMGVAGLVLALIGGERFVTTQNGVGSYLMSIGFLIALVALNRGLYAQ
jgi:hypothetical protein